MFDLSEFSRDSKFFYLANKKVISEIKYESDGKINSWFVKWKPKMYSLV